jgi:hypothetical protein
MSRNHCEHMFSASPSNPDIADAVSSRAPPSATPSAPRFGRNLVSLARNPGPNWRVNSSACSDVAPYSGIDFVIVSASDFSAPACFRINSYCFRACVLDSSTNCAAVVVPDKSRAYSKVVITFAFINSSASAPNSAAAPLRTVRKLSRLAPPWSFGASSLLTRGSTRSFAWSTPLANFLIENSAFKRKGQSEHSFSCWRALRRLSTPCLRTLADE